MVQKLSRTKGDTLSCSESIVITDFETDERICSKCGIILQDKITDTRKEWGSIIEIQHIPTSIRIHDMGLSTIIGKTNRDFVGKPLGNEMNQSMRRMRMWDSRSLTKLSSDKNLRVALYEMEKLKEKLGLTDAIIDRAAYLYRKAVKMNLIRGRTVRSMVGACVYAACRDMETRTIMDIVNNLQEKRKLIAKSYRILFQNLRLTVSVTDPINCIIKFANNLQISETTKRKAIKIFNTQRKRTSCGEKSQYSCCYCIVYGKNQNGCTSISTQHYKNFRNN